MSLRGRSVVIFGLGQIGASLAAAVSKAGWRVWGWDRDRATLKSAFRRGWISKEWMGPSASQEPPLVAVVCVPEGAVIELDDELFEKLGTLSSETALTEVFSSKSVGTTTLLAWARAWEQGFCWSHPIAGREGHGIATAEPGLFRGARVVVDSQGDPRARAAISRLWRDAGAQIESMTTHQHQQAMGAGSHLSHVVAFAAANAMQKGRAVASPSVLGVTRVAASDPEHWAGILASNARNVSRSLSDLIAELQVFQDALAQGDRLKLDRLLKSGHLARRKLEAKGSVRK